MVRNHTIYKLLNTKHVHDARHDIHYSMQDSSYSYSVDARGYI